MVVSVCELVSPGKSGVVSMAGKAQVDQSDLAAANLNYESVGRLGCMIHQICPNEVEHESAKGSKQKRAEKKARFREGDKAVWSRRSQGATPRHCFERGGMS